MGNVIESKFKMFQQFGLFRVSLLTSVRNTFPSKAFSMSETNIHQILRLSYCIKLQEWWRDVLMEIVLVLTCIETQKIQ